MTFLPARKRVQQVAEDSIAESNALKRARKYQSTHSDTSSDNQNSILNFVHKSKSMGGGTKITSSHAAKGNTSAMFLRALHMYIAATSFDIDGLLKNLAPQKSLCRPLRHESIVPQRYVHSVTSASPAEIVDDQIHADENGGEVFLEEGCSLDAKDESLKSSIPSTVADTNTWSTPRAVEETMKVSLTHTSKKLKARPLIDNSPQMIATTSIDGVDEISGSENSLNTSPLSSNVDSSWFVRQKETDNGALEEYVPFFWMDATESQGVIYLYGRIAVDEPGGQRKFVSSCCVIHGNQRNLFVLPKSKNEYRNDDSVLRASMADVYGEINSLLVPSVIPRSEGQGFRCKSVKRKYAFDAPSIPREETEYMKVVYSAKYGVPICNHEKFEHIERIFGLSSTPLEHFLLKRKLMGPSWLYIKHPRIPSHSVSWCRTEFFIDNPKNVSKIPSHEAPPAPQLSVMSLAFKTVVNTVTHTHEIVMVSGVLHHKLDIECDTEINATAMKKFALVRQLGTSSGNMYPSTFPHDLGVDVQKSNGCVATFPNERALLSMFFNKLHQEDPDVIVSHNLFGFELELLMSRATALKLPYWNKLGRLRITRVPKIISDAAGGRLLCDTYTSSKEFLRETTYSLTSLAQSQLGYERQDIDPIDVPRYFSTSQDILRLAIHTTNDAFLVLRLMLKLQLVPLTKQLTGLSGNLWCRTLKGARAERIEFLLLHEFHAMKYVLPEKKMHEKKLIIKEDNVDEVNDNNGSRKVGGVARSRSKASYAGGLVLEPKKGLYDTFILLLDFNSLYPSIIQEYNLCFTTINWTKFDSSQEKIVTEESLDDTDTISTILPPIPDPSTPQGVLPRVIKTLVDRRREVKSLLKKSRDSSTKQQLDIRQKALKLTANSMYGCLGFSFSRFYARPIAALVTAKGREALQRTVDQATTQMGLEVIYGDTDSVMINTNSTDLEQVKLVGNQVKREVNKLYKSLELDIDGIFKSMLLLKKKKYAALCVKEGENGAIEHEKEMKGLDLVRRDWCPVSKEAGKYVVDRLLSGGSREDIIQEIHEYLSHLAADMRAMNLNLSQYIITKGLNKSPKDYPDCKGQPHLQVALKMLKENKPVNIGDHIPYVICKEHASNDSLSPAERAHHPDEVARSDGKLSIDVEWYLSQQILPPISRLCDPIEGTSAAIISQHLGLDTSKYYRNFNSHFM